MRSFALSKYEIAERDRLAAALDEARLKLIDEISNYNARLEEIKVPVTDAITAYNEALSEAKEFAETIENDADSEISDKSERWQESERGEKATEFKDRWVEIRGSLDDELELTLAEDLEEPDFSGVEDFASSPTSLDEM